MMLDIAALDALDLRVIAPESHDTEGLYKKMKRLNIECATEWRCSPTLRVIGIQDKSTQRTTHVALRRNLRKGSTPDYPKYGLNGY